ncbi:hypothetical protein BC937DRAFT_88034 [Endogone sp. FLAS-F59071]|nr:hypothetical protein BC937DRAFT_88034 [Endogone sp. FLAS-F59071]|eukprot:RUS19062.1 hypothetical protein BC937DRAFT_88034 [Endogone sp. FLAS-F59071]
MWNVGSVREFARKAIWSFEPYKPYSLCSCPLGFVSSGAPAAAAGAQLVLIIAGATAEHRARLTEQLVPAIGRLAIDLGDNESLASKMKLTGNFFITSMVEMLAEGLTLGEKSGVGQQNVQKFINAFFANTPFVPYTERMVSESYNVDLAAGEKPPFSISNAVKDVTHILKMANE